MTKKKKKFTRKELDAAMLKVYKRYRHRPNFTGADVGTLWRGEEKSDEQVVRVHITAKIPVAELSDTEVFPKEINGIPLDVIEGNYKPRKASGNPRHRAAVLMGGLSVGRLNNGAGTLGAIVIDKETGRPGVLSNWHVLAGPEARRGDPILQPGRMDGGRKRDAIARLSRWILDFDGDAAVADLGNARPWLPIQNGSFEAMSGHRKPRLNEVLTKQGRSTRNTSARVDGEGIYRVSYEVQKGQFEPRDIAGFKLVPETDNTTKDIEISEPGDSGSVWCSPRDKKAVGLHFAGESDTDPLAERAIACNVSQVLPRLGLRLATHEDVVEMAEAAARAGVNPQFSQQPELTPQPDGPWPLDPWQTDPRPTDLWPSEVGPSSPLPGPAPMPFPPPVSTQPAPLSLHASARAVRLPWCHILDDPREVYPDHPPSPLSLRQGGQSPIGIGSEGVSEPLYLDTWERLKRSLILRDRPLFHDLSEGDRIEGRMLPPYWHNELAWAIYDMGQFDAVLDRFPAPHAYLPCSTFAHVAKLLMARRAVLAP
ncbi:hypothetical protein [Pseudophaeobacter sp.]|uniref:hypothetical protein n=1 Tax=Pseudophaeobacter sp. TaxID=1971739 RepID=UPI003296F761